MKLIVIAALALVAVAAAAPAESEPPKTLRSEFDQKPEGGYSYVYETDDGTSHSEEGEKKVVNDEENKPHDILAVRGQYSYVDPEGKQHNVVYFADETGFHAESEDIPKPAQA